MAIPMGRAFRAGRISLVITAGSNIWAARSAPMVSQICLHFVCLTKCTIERAVALLGQPTERSMLRGPGRTAHGSLYEVRLHHRLVDVRQPGAPGGGGYLDEFGLQDFEHALGAQGAEGA